MPESLSSMRSIFFSLYLSVDVVLVPWARHVSNTQSQGYNVLFFRYVHPLSDGLLYRSCGDASFDCQ